ncbi:MAG: hybrid sensor histidine kinase/response regulator [Candidatus Sumerlaeota bacterium]|nr:hybrid sensor histidine kinase/response regulator [Candidatus Sumerlaeota bacterium]
MERRKRVLVVDDEASNRELLEALLTSLGHDVDMAADGCTALEKLDPSHDLVLLDVMMPGIDGYEVVRRIRNESSVSDIPICMVTALSGKEERLRAVEAGVNDFIAKPIDKTELQVRTASLLKTKEAQDTIKRCQAELEAQNRILQENSEQLRKLGEQKDEFLRIASHDLKSPLTCILGFASLIDSQTPPGAAMTAETRGWTEKIAGHCRVMQKIIEDFLDFQAMEDGQIKLTLETVDINELARDVLERNAGYAAKKRITPHLDLEGGSLLVNADKSRLNQVLENFVSNAIKFSPQGKQVTVCTRKTERGVLVEVRDSGPGLTDEDMKKLFVKYAKLSNMPTGGEKSSGLGLAICRKVVEMQGGKTGARNNPEGGATFWFELPGRLSENYVPLIK